MRYFENLLSENIEGEKWAVIEGFPNYMVSTFGRVKSVDRRFPVKSFHGRLAYNQVRKGMMLSQSETYQGYLLAWLFTDGEDGEKKGIGVHRLVAKAFIPNPENKPEVNHKKGIKWDNRVSQLEWSTEEENMQHAFATGLKVGLKNDKHPLSQFKNEEVLEIRRLHSIGWNITDIANKYSKGFGIIWRIVMRKTYKDLK